MQYVWHSGVCITYLLALNQGVSGETQPNGPIHTLGKVRRKLCQNGYFQITLLFSYDAGRPVLEALYHAVNWERSTVDWPITNSPNVAIWHDIYNVYIRYTCCIYCEQKQSEKFKCLRACFLHLGSFYSVQNQCSHIFPAPAWSPYESLFMRYEIEKGLRAVYLQRRH